MKSSKLKVIIAALLCAAVTIPCAACTSEQQADENNSPSVNQSQAQAQNPSANQTESKKEPDKVESNTTQPSQNNINTDAYNEKINYYMQLVETLQAEIIELKQGHYIEESQYQSKIDELENTVSQLLDRIEAMASGSTITPVVPPNTNSGSNSGNSGSVSNKNEFEYKVSDGKATITKYTGSGSEVIIPDTIDNYTVYAIGEAAFQNCNVKSIIIPDTVRLIDWFAFAGCTSLEKITIPSSVLSVQYGAFDYCPKSMKIYCAKGSYIEAYALSWGLTVVAE